MRQRCKPSQPQLGVGIPHYVLVQLRALAARRRCSVSFLVLDALTSIGVHVDAADLVEDRRQSRPKGCRKHYAGNPRLKFERRRVTAD